MAETIDLVVADAGIVGVGIAILGSISDPGIDDFADDIDGQLTVEGDEVELAVTYLDYDAYLSFTLSDEFMLA